MIVLVWLIQLVLMASLDTRKDILNKGINWIWFLTSLVITFFWGNIFWLIIPVAVIPVLAGIIGGIVKGLYSKSRVNKNRVNK